MISIDKGVPFPEAPPSNHHGRGYPKYPWATMVIGDSFLLDGKASPGSIHSSARWWRGYIHGNPQLRITTKRVPEGIRVWRIA